MFVFTWFQGANPGTAYIWLALVMFNALSITDMKYRIIPNEFVVGIALLQTIWIATSPLFMNNAVPITENLINGAIGIAISFVVFFGGTILTGGNVGMGDVKLAMAIGFMLGWQKTLIAIAISGLLMIPIVFMPQARSLKERFKQLIPFGPAFSIATIIVLVASFTPISEYMRLI